MQRGDKMFTHAVLFMVKPKELAKYRKDSLMWASYTRRAPGFLSYRTLKRLEYANQYFSVYLWDKKASHDKFMRKYHDWLVRKSCAKVTVLGYYNLKQLDRVG